MPFRPPNFRPVLPLSTGAAVSKTLAGVLQRFGERKDREAQERRELLAALELQDIRSKNQRMLEELRSKFRREEDVAQFEMEAPVREERRRTTGLETLGGLSRDFDLTSEQMRQAQAGEEITGPLKRKPFRPTVTTAQDRVARRAIDKENRLKKTTFGGRNLGQLSDDIRSTKQLPLKDEFGEPTGQRGFETPEHQQQHEFNKAAFDLKSAGFSDFDLEQLKMNPDEAIRNFNQIKGRFIFPTLDKTGKRVMQEKLSKPQIVKLLKAGLTLEMINNGLETLRQNPRFAKLTNEALLKLLLRELNK